MSDREIIDLIEVQHADLLAKWRSGSTSFGAELKLPVVYDVSDPESNIAVVFNENGARVLRRGDFAYDRKR